MPKVPPPRSALMGENLLATRDQKMKRKLEESIDDSYILFFDDHDKTVEDAERALLDFVQKQDLKLENVNKLTAIGFLIVDMSRQVAEQIHQDTDLIVVANTENNLLF